MKPRPDDDSRLSGKYGRVRPCHRAVVSYDSGAVIGLRGLFSSFPRAHGAAFFTSQLIGAD